MNKYCPYCRCEVDGLNAVKETALEWNGDTWVDDPKAITVLQCPECGDELESIDLGILGISFEMIMKATK